MGIIYTQRVYAIIAISTVITMITITLSPHSPRKKKGSCLHKYKGSHTPKSIQRTVAMSEVPGQ